MNRPTRLAAAVAVALLASGCANTTFHIPFMGDDDSAKDPSYAQARKAMRNRPLEVPPDLTAPESGGAYAVPGLSGNQISAEGKKVLESGAVLPKFDKVRMETVAGQRWLVVNTPAESVWPIARDFWLEQGFKLTTESPATGILETDWREQRPDLPVGGIRAALQRGLNTLYSTGQVDQYRMRLERGSEAGTTEIYISHRAMEEVYIDKEHSDTRWTVRKPEPEREAEQLKKLLVRLGVTADAASQVVSNTLPAAGADAVGKPAAGSALARATLTQQADGKRALVLNEGFDRSWRRVGLALEHAGYTVNDRDRSLGLYYVHPAIDKNGKPQEVSNGNSSGWWNKLAFWKSDEKKPVDAPAGPEYLIIVSGKDGQTHVRAGTREGSKLPQATADTILDALYGELR
jgi:outer membrane protein assembly factor BamC